MKCSYNDDIRDLKLSWKFIRKFRLVFQKSKDCSGIFEFETVYVNAGWQRTGSINCRIEDIKNLSNMGASQWDISREL